MIGLFVATLRWMITVAYIMRLAILSVDFGERASPGHSHVGLYSGSEAALWYMIWEMNAWNDVIP